MTSICRSRVMLLTLFFCVLPMLSGPCWVFIDFQCALCAHHANFSCQWENSLKTWYLSRALKLNNQSAKGSKISSNLSFSSSFPVFAEERRPTDEKKTTNRLKNAGISLGTRIQFSNIHSLLVSNFQWQWPQRLGQQSFIDTPKWIENSFQWNQFHLKLHNCNDQRLFFLYFSFHAALNLTRDGWLRSDFGPAVEVDQLLTSIYQVWNARTYNLKTIFWHFQNLKSCVALTLDKSSWNLQLTFTFFYSVLPHPHNMSANNGHWMSGGNASFETNKSAESVQHPHQVASAPSGLKWVRIVNQIKRHIWMMKTLIFQCSIVCLQRCSRVDSIFFFDNFQSASLQLI